MDYILIIQLFDRFRGYFKTNPKKKGVMIMKLVSDKVFKLSGSFTNSRATAVSVKKLVYCVLAEGCISIEDAATKKEVAGADTNLRICHESCGNSCTKE